MKARAALAALVLGVFTDFVVNGVLKVHFAIIYVPVYVGLASILSTRFYHTKHEPLIGVGIIAYLAGAFGGHFALVGHEHQRTYTMRVAGDSPLTLRSGEFSQYLVVVGRAVEAALKSPDAPKDFAVTVSYLADYGCIDSNPKERRYFVDTVAGVDVRYDKESSWTWKTDKTAVPTPGGPGLEDASLPWCQIKFF